MEMINYVFGGIWFWQLSFREIGNVHEVIDSKRRSQSSRDDALEGGETVNQNAKRVCQFYRWRSPRNYGSYMEKINTYSAMV